MLIWAPTRRLIGGRGRAQGALSGALEWALEPAAGLGGQVGIGTTNNPGSVVENFWAPGSYNAVELIGEEAVWEKLTYVAVNAVRAGLVRDPLDWPGFRTTPEDMLGNRMTALRPGVFFTDDMPEQVELRLCPPPALQHLEPKEIEAELKRRIEAAVRKIRRARKKAKLGWLGRKKVLVQRVDDSPGGTFRAGERIDPIGT